MNNLTSKLESILLVSGDPVAVKTLAKTLDEDIPAVESALAELKAHYEGRGIRLVSDGAHWQFATAPENADLIEALVKNEFGEELSKAAMETIAVIAYKGPITRHDIDYTRGVNSSFTVRNLLLRGLVDRVENPKDARSFLYAVNMEFLKYLGVAGREDLPQWETWRDFPIPKRADEHHE